MNTKCRETEVQTEATTDSHGLPVWERRTTRRRRRRRRRRERRRMREGVKKVLCLQGEAHE